MTRRAFTLVETLMALSLTAVLAAGGVMLTLELAQAWAGRETEAGFRRHTAGLGRFLEDALADTRELSPSAAGLWETPPGEPPASPPALRLLFRDLGRVAEVRPGSRPAGEGWLMHEPESGLVLLWRTFREKRLNATMTHRMILSPFCESFRVAEYDPVSDRWAEFSPVRADAGRDRSLMLMLRLRRHGETAEIRILPEGDPGHAPAP